jgi:hypothetical protein
MALAWVNFFKQRLHVLQTDYKHIAADRIVIASRPVAAESVALLIRSAAESADTYVTAARGNASAHNTHNPTAAQAARRRAELGDRAAQFGEPSRDRPARARRAASRGVGRDHRRRAENFSDVARQDIPTRGNT